MAVAKLNTTTSARFNLDAWGRKPASAAHVKKLSMARAKQYRDISILRLFFSIASAKPVKNCKWSNSVSSKDSSFAKNCGFIKQNLYSCYCNQWNVASLETSEEHACPSPSDVLKQPEYSLKSGKRKDDGLDVVQFRTHPSGTLANRRSPTYLSYFGYFSNDYYLRLLPSFGGITRCVDLVSPPSTPCLREIEGTQGMGTFDHRFPLFVLSVILYQGKSEAFRFLPVPSLAEGWDLPVYPALLKLEASKEGLFKLISRAIPFHPLQINKFVLGGNTHFRLSCWQQRDGRAMVVELATPRFSFYSAFLWRAGRFGFAIYWSRTLAVREEIRLWRKEFEAEDFLSVEQNETKEVSFVIILSTRAGLNRAGQIAQDLSRIFGKETGQFGAELQGMGC
ncbi:hypothetical protein M5K25_023618 [Dendrobium thyrsiflorum]|uniref:Uncharacterized protein n=1 Tax=Dendrobium thyrsiflorum TaxID=117978 RepID=A0ABD0U982_DENTH